LQAHPHGKLKERDLGLRVSIKGGEHPENVFKSIAIPKINPYKSYFNNCFLILAFNFCKLEEKSLLLCLDHLVSKQQVLSTSEITLAWSQPDENIRNLK